jgi:hypothetical protein
MAIMPKQRECILLIVKKVKRVKKVIQCHYFTLQTSGVFLNFTLKLALET